MPPTGKPAGSGTARMDASKAAQMEEVIKKEQRCDFCCAPSDCCPSLNVICLSLQVCCPQDPGKG